MDESRHLFAKVMIRIILIKVLLFINIEMCNIYESIYFYLHESIILTKNITMRRIRRQTRKRIKNNDMMIKAYVFGWPGHKPLYKKLLHFQFIV